MKPIIEGSLILPTILPQKRDIIIKIPEIRRGKLCRRLSAAAVKKILLFIMGVHLIQKVYLVNKKII
jgi:hypothetical protein